jgi:hypothetical protein
VSEVCRLDATSVERPGVAGSRLPAGNEEAGASANARRSPAAGAGGVMIAVTYHEYRVAFVTTSGTWDVVEVFQAIDDDDANDHAERNYPGRDWFVLDASGRNVNGGVDGGGRCRG